MKSVVNDTDGIVRVAESVIPEIKHQDEVRVKSQLGLMWFRFTQDI